MKLFTCGRRHLPPSTGPYSVGCCDVMTGYTKSGAFFRLFYPVKKSEAKEVYVQWPRWRPHPRYTEGSALRLGVFPKLFEAFYSLFVGDVFIPAQWQATIVQDNMVFPVIIFSHGLAAWRNAYSSICLEIASYGYIVAAVEHRDHSAASSFYIKQARMSWYGQYPGSDLGELNELLQKWSDAEWEEAMAGEWSPKPVPQTIGPNPHKKEWIRYKPVMEDEPYVRRQQLNQRVQECRHVCEVLKGLNEGTFTKNVMDPYFRSEMFRGRMDLNKMAVIGHSFGGATAILALAKELHFRIGVALDPWMLPFQTNSSALANIQKPLLVVITDGFQQQKDLEIMKKLQKTHDCRTFLKISKSEHRDQSDVPFLGCPFLPMIIGSSSRRSGLRTTYLTVQAIMEMFSKHFGICMPKRYTDVSLKMKFLEELEM